MGGCLGGFAFFTAVIVVLSRVLNCFDFSFVESGQEKRCMGGQVKDNGYGAKARIDDNIYLKASGKAIKSLKKRWSKRKAELLGTSIE